MERYLTQQRTPREPGATEVSPDASASSNMATAPRGNPPLQGVQSQPTHEPPAQGTSPQEEMDTVAASYVAQDNTHERIAKAVAALLSPTITAAVEKAVAVGMQQLRKEVGELSLRISTAEQRLSSVEDDQYNTHGSMERFIQDQQHLHERMEDLENRSRRNNLRIIGLPETYKPGSLLDICSTALPESLGLGRKCVVERAHRIGAVSEDRARPRPVIARYLNYADRMDVLQSFRKARAAELDGHKLLIFADYSVEVSRKRKEFQPMCAELYKRGIRFTLAYPAILRLQTPNGDQLTLQSPDKARAYLQSLNADRTSSVTYADRVKQGPRDQRSPRKDPPKRLKPTTAPGQQDSG